MAKLSSFSRAQNMWFVTCLLLLIFRSSWAQSPVEPALEIQRQELRERILRKGLEPSPDVSIPRVAVPVISDIIPENESPCLTISHITLAGDSAEHFQFALSAAIEGDDPAIDRCLGIKGINTTLTRIQNTIIAKGYITTRVLVTPQNLKTGELKFTVIPGRIHTIKFADDASPRGRYWNALPANPGDLLNLRDVEQALENFKRVPTADADIQIEPASALNARPGESDIVINYSQSVPFRITLSANDSGSRSTGKNQGSATLSGDNLLTLNDLFYYSINHDLGNGGEGQNGTSGYTLHYSLPIDYWLLGITSSQYDYHQAVAGANQTFIYSGESSNAELKLSRLIYRDAVRKTTVSLLTYLKSSRNFIDETEIEVQRRRMAGWQANVSHKEFIAAATLDIDLAYRQGTGMFDALEAPEEPFGEGTARPKIITANLGLALPFKFGTQQFRYNSTLRAQWNKTPLVPQDRFAIGGRHTVRGFDGELTLSAERGWLFRNDLGLILGNSGQELYLGLDYGHVSGPTAELLLGHHLAGGVVGLRGGYKGLYWDLFVGGPINKPKGFKPSTGVSGFSVSWTY